ncbi:hypothetical protein [Naumannella halotolerans]|uniref:Uncharacterized protein n=1 Tax=Naumannella halotolerans TaxID=993414 RepID=A0A4V6Q2B4_9ACTN|nr:hypothetical protein [Naumannella halotolerans]TDT31098.1 hypothetical protein CLV29_2511 [Naumannella halotolerans]
MSEFLKLVKSGEFSPTYRHLLCMADDRLLSERAELDAERQQKIADGEKKVLRYGGQSVVDTKDLDDRIDQLDVQIADATFEAVFRALDAARYDKIVEDFGGRERTLPDDADDAVVKKARAEDYEAVGLELAKQSYVELLKYGEDTGTSRNDWAEALDHLSPADKQAIVSEMWPLHLRRDDAPKAVKRYATARKSGGA